MTSSRWVRWAVGAGLAVGVVLASAGAAGAVDGDGPEVRRATERGVRERALEDAPGSVGADPTTVVGFERATTSYDLTTEHDLVRRVDGSVFYSGRRRGQGEGPDRFDRDQIYRAFPSSAAALLSTGSGRGHGLGVGPDGNVWFIGPAGIGRATPSLAVVHPGFGVPGDITTGPDGNLWFVEYNANGVVGRYDMTTGSVTTFAAGLHYPEEIVAGPDGNLWITSGGNDRIVRVTPQGQSTIFWSPPTSGEVIVDNEWGLRSDVGFDHCPPVPGECTAFSLDDDAEVLPAVDPTTLADRTSIDVSVPGVHTVTATGVPPGMVVSAIECTGPGATVDLANRRVTLMVDGSQDLFSCTFELTGASLGVVMVGTAADVTFSSCGPDNPAACFYYVLDDDNTEPHRNRRGEAGLPAATYVVRLEELPPFHTLAAINCTGGGTTVDLPNRRVTVALGAQDVACTFVVDP